MSKSTYFFKYEELMKVKHLFKQDAYYKAGRAICNYFLDKYPVDVEIEKEIIKIRKVFKKPRCTPDLYTPTDDELKKTLAFLKENHEQYYRLYIGLVSSGVRITELLQISNSPKDYRILDCGDYKKVVLNKTRNTKSAYFVYLPKDYVFPEAINRGSLNGYICKHKQVIRPKYLRNWFYKKCIELGIPASIADFYQGRSPISVGNKHYLEKESLADSNYLIIFECLNTNMNG